MSSAEFDNWYNESFATDAAETSASAGYGGRPGLKLPARLQIDADQGFEADEVGNRCAVLFCN